MLTKSRVLEGLFDLAMPLLLTHRCTRYSKTLSSTFVEYDFGLAACDAVTLFRENFFYTREG